MPLVKKKLSVAAGATSDQVPAVKLNALCKS